jgi:hypothetical protein
MPDPTPTFNEIKIVMKCDQSWENTINPTDETIRNMPVQYRIIAGEVELFGYIEACEDFKIIDKETADQLKEKYHTHAKEALKNI